VFFVFYFFLFFLYKKNKKQIKKKNNNERIDFIYIKHIEKTHTKKKLGTKNAFGFFMSGLCMASLRSGCVVLWVCCFMRVTFYMGFMTFYVFYACVFL